MAEALLFAATEPLDEPSVAARLPDGADVPAVLAELSAQYDGRGVNLVRIGGKWSFRTSPDLAHVLERHITQPRRLSRAGVETLAIIAYHQPVSRAEVEEIRGVALSKGTLDTLLEVGWIKPKGRRRTPGRPVTYGTTDEFLEHFGIETLNALPGLEELKATGLLRREPPQTMLREAEERARSDAEAATGDGTGDGLGDGEGDRDGEVADGADDDGGMDDSRVETTSVVPLKRPD